MNFSRQVKEEFPASSSSFSGGVLPPTATAPPPQPIEGLHEASPPPFLTKTYEIIEDTATDHIVSWSRGNNSFVVWDLQSFSLTLLPKYFKHCNFSSFVRQLNTYVSQFQMGIVLIQPNQICSMFFSGRGLERWIRTSGNSLTKASCEGRDIFWSWFEGEKLCNRTFLSKLQTHVSRSDGLGSTAMSTSCSVTNRY